MNERVFVAGWQLVFSHSNANGPLGDFRYLLCSSTFSPPHSALGQLLLAVVVVVDPKSRLLAS
jgi:hypothetical protein